MPLALSSGMKAGSGRRLHQERGMRPTLCGGSWLRRGAGAGVGVDSGAVSFLGAG